MEKACSRFTCTSTETTRLRFPRGKVGGGICRGLFHPQALPKSTVAWSASLCFPNPPNINNATTLIFLSLGGREREDRFLFFVFLCYGEVNRREREIEISNNLQICRWRIWLLPSLIRLVQVGNAMPFGGTVSAFPPCINWIGDGCEGCLRILHGNGSD